MVYPKHENGDNWGMVYGIVWTTWEGWPYGLCPQVIYDTSLILLAWCHMVALQQILGFGAVVQRKFHPWLQLVFLDANHPLTIYDYLIVSSASQTFPDHICHDCHDIPSAVLPNSPTFTSQGLHLAKISRFEGPHFKWWDSVVPGYRSPPSRKYSLVNSNSYWKLRFLVDLPIKNWVFP